MGYVKELFCPACRKKYDVDVPQNLCSCGKPLLVDYDLEKAREERCWENWSARPFNMWRYHELLPVAKEEYRLTLGEGGTPLYGLPHMGSDLGLNRLLIKDEGLNPTGSFKARGAACGVSMAKGLGIKDIAMPTAGNAGAAWSAYCARGGLRAHIAMPSDTPTVLKEECKWLGADLYEVDGIISDAGHYIGQLAKERGWFQVGTLKEPYRIEGKKTMGFELVEQLHWDVPDAILYPTGGGVGLIGIWKAIGELKSLGLLPETRSPKMIGVQAEGCAPLVKAFEGGLYEAEFWQGARTVAPGIRVPSALGDFLVLEAIYESGGAMVSVSDEALMEGAHNMAAREGLLICPEAGACVAAIPMLLDQGLITRDDQVLIINTGSGLQNIM